jgi:hypothetical protein
LVEHRLEGEPFREAAALDFLKSEALTGFLRAFFAELMVPLHAGHVLSGTLDSEQQVFLAL